MRGRFNRYVRNNEGENVMERHIQSIVMFIITGILSYSGAKFAEFNTNLAVINQQLKTLDRRIIRIESQLNSRYKFSSASIKENYIQ